MSNNKKVLITIGTIILVTVTGIFWYVNSRETITDLGDGWKSYHHKKVGITVKIPEDAEVNVNRNLETHTINASFSKGSIKNINTWLLYYGDKNKSYGERVEAYREKISEKNNKWISTERQIKKGIKTRKIYKEVKIKEKTIFIEFFESENTNGVNNEFYIEAIRIPVDETRFGYVRFGSASNRLHETYPYLLEGDIETRMNAYIEVVKELVISIDEDA